jgi:hypothetical protein
MCSKSPFNIVNEQSRKLWKEKQSIVLSGGSVIMSDEEYDSWIDDGMPSDVVSIPNPKQCGTLDPWVVALVTSETIGQYKLNNKNK